MYVHTYIIPLLDANKFFLTSTYYILMWYSCRLTTEKALFLEALQDAILK